jgi:hypothetical protein
MSRRGRGPAVVGRNSRPSLVQTAATTAVVVGTAKVVGNAMDGGSSAQAQQQSAVAQQQMADQQAAMMAQSAAAPTGLTDEGIQKLKELASLKDAGIITEIEFEVQKAKILNG